MTRRIGPLSRRSRSLPAISIAAAMLAVIPLIATPGTGLAAARGPATVSAINPVGELDCNGYSPVQAPFKAGGVICAEVHGGSPDRQLYDNGYYIGHDEPTIQFYSRHPGSSTRITWVQTLPRDPHTSPDGERAAEGRNSLL